MKASLNEKDDKEDLEKAPPQSEAPDGGWGWMVVFASFLCNLILEGISFSYAQLLTKIMSEYDVSASTATLAWCLMYGVYLISAPIAGVLANKYGCRRLTMIGGIIASGAYLASTVAENFFWILVTIGLFGGIGYGLVYLPCIVVIGFWFDKRRALATGFVLTGAGIGMFIFPPITEYLLEEYDLKGTLIIFSGLLLQCVVCGAIFRPVEVPRPKPMKRVGYIARGSIMEALIKEKKRQRTISNGSLDNCIITKDNDLIKIEQLFLANRSDVYIQKLKASLGISCKSLNRSKNSLVIPTIRVNSPPRSGSCTPVSVSTPTGGVTPVPVKKQNFCDSDSGNVSLKDEKEDKEAEKETEAAKEGGAAAAVPKCHSYSVLPHSGQWDSPKIDKSLLDAKSVSCQNVNGDVAVDIENNIADPETQSCLSTESEMTSPGSQASVVSGLSLLSSNGSNGLTSLYSASVATYYGDYEESMFDKWFNVARKLFDFGLLRSPTFALFVLASFLCNFAFYIPYILSASLAKTHGMKDHEGTIIMTVIGVANTIGRILAGWLANRPCINVLWLFNGALVVNGIATILCPWIFTTYTAFLVYASIFGLGLAVYVSMRTVVLIELLGIDKLNNSFGLVLLAQGVATICGIPLLRADTFINSNLDTTYLMAGILIVISGLLGCPLARVKKREERRNNAKYLSSDYSIQETLKIEQVVPLN